jgi:predicted nucleic acid-binding protein
MIFVDTSGWLALADAHDRDHARARALEPRIARGEFGKQVTTNYVLTETVTILRRRMGLPVAVRFARGLTSSDEVRIFWIEPVHHREAVQFMEAHADKTWSLTDCSSFVVMKGLGIENAFAFDHDFAQAGFRVYPHE